MQKDAEEREREREGMKEGRREEGESKEIVEAKLWRQRLNVSCRALREVKLALRPGEAQ